MIYRTFLCFLLIAIALSTSARAESDVKIGVLAHRGVNQCLEQWGPLGKYLTEKLGRTATIVPLEFDAIDPAIRDAKINFVLANPGFYVEMREKYGITAAATMVNFVRGKAVKEFGGVIFVRKDSPAMALADLKGKKFMCVEFASLGGWQMSHRLFLDNGIDPKKDFAQLTEGKKHDNVIFAVKNGAMDAGTVRTDVLERMQDEGKISLDDFRVLNPQTDDFPFVRSTILYPEWPLAALKGTDEKLAADMSAALLALPKDSDAAKAGKIAGWVAPVDYTPVRDCLKAIRYGVFAETSK